MNEKERDEELRSMAPQLQQWQQQSSDGQVPKDYFQNFEARLQRRLATEQSLEPAAVPTWPQRVAQWWQGAWKPAMAAALPALALLIWWGNGWGPSQPVLTPAPTFADLSTREIDQYVEGHLELFTSQELASLLDEEALEWQELGESPEAAPTTSAKEALDKALKATNTEDLLDELDVEDLDLEDLDLEEDWL